MSKVIREGDEGYREGQKGDKRTSWRCVSRVQIKPKTSRWKMLSMKFLNVDNILFLIKIYI